MTETTQLDFCGATLCYYRRKRGESTLQELSEAALMPLELFEDWEFEWVKPQNTPENRMRVRRIAETLDIDVCDLRGHDVRYLLRLLAVFLLDEDK